MKEIVSLNCPLCGHAAEYRGADYGRRKTFTCPNCTYFQISEQAERKVAEAPQQWRDDLSNKAKSSPEDQILVIVVPSKPSKSDGAYVSLSGKYVASTEVPT